MLACNNIASHQKHLQGEREKAKIAKILERQFASDFSMI